MDSLMARYHALCTPAKVFAVLQLLGVAGGVAKQAADGNGGAAVASLIGGGVTLWIVTWLLNLMCQHHMTWLAWVVAVGPIVLFAVLGGLAGVLAYLSSKNSKPKKH